MLNFSRLKDFSVANKNVIVRVDINVPVIDGNIEDDTRIKAIIPTLKYLSKQKAKVVVISHFGRPDGKFDATMSLKPLISRVQELLGDEIKVFFATDCIGEVPRQAIENADFGDVVILENLRFYKEETKNDNAFAAKLASFAEIYVNDAFSCSHRAHASIVGIASHLKSCAGFLLESELDNLSQLLENAKKPMMAVVGGAKISTKLDLLNSLIYKAQTIIVAGGMANSFLYAIDKNVGKSLCEKDLKNEVLSIIEKSKAAGCSIVLPSDVVVAKSFSQNAECKNVSLEDVSDNDMILDIGKQTSEHFENLLKSHKTLLWNGPLGAFEVKPFHIGTATFAKNAANLTKQGSLLSIAGGGDVVSAINSCNLADEFTYISTAGGAFLEWLEGKELPGVLALKSL